MKFDELVSRTYPIEDIEVVFEDMKAARIARGVLAIGS